MAQPITPTVELLHRLVNAQAKHTAELLLSGGPWGDDSGDDMSGALDAMTILHSLSWDQDDLESLGLWLNDEGNDGGNGTQRTPVGLITRLSYLACDGICEELYDLDCPALPKLG